MLAVCVIDTGLGEAVNVGSKGLGGQLLANMVATGIDPKSVDAVIITHMHPDHINGPLRADGTLAFPNAEVLVPAAERAFWFDDGEKAGDGYREVALWNPTMWP